MDKRSATRFYPGGMFTYLLTLSALSAVAVLAGWHAGRGRRRDKTRLTTLEVMVWACLPILWFLAAQKARKYADTDGFGSAAAEWFAHSGKWLLLLAGVMFVHGWIIGAAQLPGGVSRRTLYSIAILGVAILAISRSTPVYFLLDQGRRDEKGCLRQSTKIEVTCAAVALLNYLERHRNHAALTEREVSRVCALTMEGTTTSALLRAARHYGLTNATARALKELELEKTKLPAIVSISTLPGVHHATLLLKLDHERAYFLDPAYGYCDLTRQRFQEVWYGKTVLLE